MVVEKRPVGKRPVGKRRVESSRLSRLAMRHLLDDDAKRAWNADLLLQQIVAERIANRLVVGSARELRYLR